MFPPFVYSPNRSYRATDEDLLDSTLSWILYGLKAQYASVLERLTQKK